MSMLADHSAPASTRPADPRRCPFCGGSATPAFTATDRNRECSAEPFSYRRCTRCGTLSLVDVPTDLGRFYPASYYELPPRGSLGPLAPTEAHKVAMIREHAEPGRLVEIGPGAGVFAYAARQAGFDVTAIEMDERACRHLSEEAGVTAIHSDDPVGALADLPPSRAIALWHVIEHLPDPGGMLDAAAANLEPGGVLALATPNPQALQFRLMRERWAHVDAPRHLFLIPLAALSDRAAAGGLRRVAVTTSDPSGRHWNRMGWEYGMRRRPAAGPANRALSLSALALTVALRPVEHARLNGTAYSAVFVKRPG